MDPLFWIRIKSIPLFSLSFIFLEHTENAAEKYWNRRYRVYQTVIFSLPTTTVKANLRDLANLIYMCLFFQVGPSSLKFSSEALVFSSVVLIPAQIILKSSTTNQSIMNNKKGNLLNDNILIMLFFQLMMLHTKWLLKDAND